MALADDAMWEAGEWQVERFNIAPQPVQQSKVASAGTKLMGLFGGAAKASTLCQVRTRGSLFAHIADIPS